MSISLVTEEAAAVNPLDLVEQFVTANDWLFERRSDDELAVEVPGQWCNYSLYFAWREDVGAMSFACALDMKVPVSKQAQVFELLAEINEKMWLGHFGLWEEDRMPIFRHAALLRGSAGLTPEQIEDLMEIAVAECERFYPAFQFVIWGGKTAKEAIAASLLDTVGEA